jgi:hypothetical protein
MIHTVQYRTVSSREQTRCVHACSYPPCVVPINDGICDEYGAKSPIAIKEARFEREYESQTDRHVIRSRFGCP